MRVAILLGVLASCRKPGKTGVETRPQPVGFVSPIAELRHRAGEAFREKRYEEAVELRKKVIEMLPEGHYERKHECWVIASYCREAGETEAMIAAYLEGEHYTDAARELASIGRFREAGETVSKLRDILGRPYMLKRAADYFRKAGDDTRADRLLLLQARRAGHVARASVAKLGPLCRRLHSAIFAIDVEQAQATMNEIKQTFPRSRWPVRQFVDYAQASRYVLDREEAAGFLNALLNEAPEKKAAWIFLGLAHLERARDPSLYEQYLLKAAYHPLDPDGYHSAQQRAKEELADFYEATGRFKDAARVLERHIRSSWCGTGAETVEFWRTLRIFDLRRHFLQKERVLEAMWKEVAGTGIHEPDLAAYYVARAYDGENRADELRRLAHDFVAEARESAEEAASGKEPKRVRIRYAELVLEAIEKELAWRAALKKGAPDIVLELAETKERSSLPHTNPLTGTYCFGRGWELVLALRRFPKKDVTPLLRSAFEARPGNIWIAIAMAENGEPQLVTALFEKARKTADWENVQGYLRAVAYSAAPGAEEMIRELAETKKGLPQGVGSPQGWVVGEALAYLADVRERKAAEK